MIRVNHSISKKTEEQIVALMNKLGATKSELVRRAIFELWVREVEAKKEGK